MTESALTDQGGTVGSWNELIRRARIGRDRKLFCFTFSSYGNKDGRRIFCGVARLAVDCEMGYSTARRYLAWLRKVGLCELVKKGNRRRHLADEYRLLFGPEILEHLDVPDPDVYREMIEALSAENRAGSAKREARRRVPRSADSVEGRAEPQDPAPDLRSPKASVGTDPVPTATPGTSALALGERSNGYLRSLGPLSALALGERPPSIDHLPVSTTFHKDGENLRTDLTVPDARGAEQPDFEDQGEATPEPALPAEPATVCPHHGLPLPAGEPRSDGKPRCTLCRRGLPPTTAAPTSALTLPRTEGADAA